MFSPSEVTLSVKLSLTGQRVSAIVAAQLFFPVLEPGGESTATPTSTRSRLRGHSQRQGAGQGKTKSQPARRCPSQGTRAAGIRLLTLARRGAETAPPAVKPARGDRLIDPHPTTCPWAGQMHPPRSHGATAPVAPRSICGSVPAHASHRLPQRTHGGPSIARQAPHGIPSVLRIPLRTADQHPATLPEAQAKAHNDVMQPPPAIAGCAGPKPGLPVGRCRGNPTNPSPR